MVRWESWVTQPVRCTPLWPASWLPVVDKSRGSKPVEVQRVLGDFMMIVFSICLDRMPLCLISRLIIMIFLLLGLCGSRAAESALVDAF